MNHTLALADRRCYQGLALAYICVQHEVDAGALLLSGGSGVLLKICNSLRANM